MPCVLFSCFILVRLYRTLIRAQHIDILVVSLHEIMLTSDLLYRLAIGLQALEQLRISLVLGVVFVDLVLKGVYLKFILHALHEAILVEETHDGNAQHNHYQILIVAQETPNGIKPAAHNIFYSDAKIKKRIEILDFFTYFCNINSENSMEEYIVSARKYRPMNFDSVVGQSALTTTLKNAVKSGKLAHAYLFCGPRGVGKTTCARIFAKAINCQHPSAEGEACNECESCKAFNEQRSYNIFELDAASNNSVENIKTLMDQTRIPPQVGRYKVFIIDEVHMLSTAAFNAFLKTLEEPPAHVVFILATTEKHKILPTIISRCQIYDFQRMTVPEIIDHLKKVAERESIHYEEEALSIIAEKADGGMRDALSIFDQAASFSQGNITYQKVIEDLNVLDSDNYFRIIDLALENKVPDVMLLLNALITKGFDAGLLVNGLASHVRDVMMAKDIQTLPLLEVSEQQRQRFQQQAEKCPTPFLYKALEILNRCDVNYRQSSNKRLLVELTIIEVSQITQPDDDKPGAGRSPRRLKSLFQNLIAPQPKAAPQVAAEEKPVARQTKAAFHREEKTAPSAQPAADASPKNRLKFGSIGLTFSNLLNNGDQETKEEDDQPITDKKKEFDDDKLAHQWMSMCLRMEKTELVGLAQRMKNLTPTILQYPEIEVVVDNSVLLEQLTAIRPRIEKTMKVGLDNSELQLHLRLARQEEFKPILNNREIFELLKEKNPALKKLSTALSLELG